jgi:peptidoglycan/xylan/chitin deacetylase (PgdA/CDA1 family)
VSSPAFSPNGDGRFEAVTASVTVGEPGTLTLEVLDATGGVVRTIALDEPITAGETETAWRGLDDARTVVPDGTYTLRASVVDALGDTATAETSVTVDTTPPRLRWRSIAPDPVRTSNGEVTFSLSMGAGAARLVVTSSDGRPVHRDAWTASGGLERRTWSLRDGGSRVSPGRYTVTVTVRDDVANTRSAARSFRDEQPVHAEVVRRVEGAGDRVALTFDDCLDDAAWASMLRTLERAGVHATFFCPGQQVLAAPMLARRTVALGNAVGSHGWDHADMTTLSVAEISHRLDLDERAWWRTAHATAVPLLRPPYGDVDADTIAAAGANGFRWLVLWDVDPADWQRPGASAIARRVLSHVRAGSIVVMHVLSQTADALPAILRGLRTRHLEPVTVTDLLEHANATTGGSVQLMPV